MLKIILYMMAKALSSKVEGYEYYCNDSLDYSVSLSLSPIVIWSILSGQGNWQTDAV